MSSDFRISENSYIAVSSFSVGTDVAPKPIPESELPRVRLKAATQDEIAAAVAAADATRAELEQRRKHLRALKAEHAAAKAKLTSTSPAKEFAAVRDCAERIELAGSELDAAINASSSVFGREAKALASGRYDAFAAEMDGPGSRLGKAKAALETELVEHKARVLALVVEIIDATVERNAKVREANAVASLAHATPFTEDYLPGILQAISEKLADRQWQHSGSRMNISLSSDSWNDARVNYEGSIPVPKEKLNPKR